MSTTPAPSQMIILVGSAVIASFFDGQHKVHTLPAHVLAVGPKDEETGQPVLSLAFPDPNAADRVFGSPRWYEGYRRETGVLHHTHPRIEAGQESIAWGHPLGEEVIPPLIQAPEGNAARPYFEREVLPEVAAPSIEQSAAVQSGLAPTPTTQSPLVNTPNDGVIPPAAPVEVAPEPPAAPAAPVGEETPTQVPNAALEGTATAQ